MNPVRVGVIGIGNMGSSHARQLAKGEVPGAVLSAICDIKPELLKTAKEKYPAENLQLFESTDELFDSGCCDGIIIATPHYDHPSLTIKAFEKGLHVLSEKPAGVFTKDVRQMNAVADKCDKIFGLMFQQRTNPVHKKVRDLIESGELGDLKRNSWLLTNWYRPQSYYNSGGWRATWAGEGGGVLLNQCPHNLDLWQWFVGQPKRIMAFCSFGKYHNIEVEDDVTAYVEYEDGSTGVFVTSTADAPGTNRLEISGDKGKLVMEAGQGGGGAQLVFYRNRMPERQFNAEYTGGFGSPECWRCEIPTGPKGGDHLEVIQKWVVAIQENDPSKLVADGREGIKSLEISNAMLLSTWTNDWVELPIDEDLFYEKLQERIQSSTFKKEVSDRVLDVTGTH